MWEEDGNLRYRAPKGALTDDRLKRLREAKAAVLDRLRADRTEAVVVPDPGARYEPFPLTDVQQAYLLGRSEVFDHGGVACHVYLEVTYPDLDPARAEAAWNRLVERHDMLRAVVEADGYQRVLPDVPHLPVPAADLRGAGEEAVQEELAAVREEFGHRVYPTDQWPLFDLRVTRTDERAVLHLSMDFLIADWASIWLLLAEFEALHADPDRELRELELTFRDYLLAERRLRETGRHRQDRDYWWERLDELPAGPDLPLADLPLAEREDVPARFRRRYLKLDTPVWEGLKHRAQQRGLTPSSAVLAAYAATLERWSRSPRFSLNLTVLNRLPLHPEVGRVVGDFTSVNLLAVDWGTGSSFTDRAAALTARLFDDLDHRLCSGVEVMRELARRRGREAALMPIVFTSAIGLGEGDDGNRAAGRLDGLGITQTPQVFIDCQAMDDADGLQVNWDIRDGVFPDGLADDMFDAFEALLRGLAADEARWDADDTVPLPARQAEERRQANDTAAPLPDTLLHEGFFAQAAETPDRPAVIGAQTTSYRDLADRAAAVAEALRARGCTAGERVAIVMDKGVDQISAVLGTLLAGAVYLPVDTVQPPLRRATILQDAGVRHLLTQSWLTDGLPADAIAVDELRPVPAPAHLTPADPDTPAYVIYTSGSTGRPKGVVVSHRAAQNTVVDINRRFAVTAEDRVLGLANLGFDLSVYDIFGPLAVGGTLVLPDPARRTDPSHWAELIAEHGVTLWNSVPALMQMLATYLATEPALDLPTLRTALLSGDWIPLTLPDEISGRLPGLQVVSLGGATEAAIWSIHHVYRGLEPGWRSIPYGRPLANQAFRVLDARGRDCPVWVPGELYIAGDGLAQGYLGDAGTTAHRFVTHGGVRLYRTGDFGRYLPGGEIEFLGREDTQVKVRGHRIELGEIEAALLEHPAVAAAGAVLDGSAADRGLLAVVEPARVPADRPGDGLAEDVRTAADGAVEGLDRALMETYGQHLDAAVLASMAHALRTVDAADIAPEHRWLVRRWQAVLAEAGPVDPDSAGQHWAGLEGVWTDALGSAEFVAYLRRNAELLPELLTGRQDPVALLFPDGRFDTAHSLYREHVMARYLNRAVGRVFRRILDLHPGDRPLRVLEAGAGTGGTTEGVLEVLAGTGAEYLFTDVAPFFLPEARRRFGGHDGTGIGFGVFDVDRDHRAQGLAPNSFDVVLAAGVLENARDIEVSLARLAELVAPGGWLVLTEPTREHPWILASQAFMMTEPEDERRAGGPSYHDRDAWLELLAAAGAEDVLCLPEAGHPLEPQGIHLFAARLKTDRAPVTENELVSHLAARLPAHMLPSHVQIADALPLTGNGKVDRRTLATWRPAQAAARQADGGDRPADALESALAELWAAALACGPIGRTDNFYDLGADSLIMARMAGRLREEVPEAADVAFDALLRHLLNEPNTAALARFLRGRSTPEPVPGRGTSGNALLVPFSTGGDGPLRVMFHAGLGTMDCYRPLAKELVAQRLGPVLGVVIDDTEVYCALDPASVIEKAADDYAERLLAEGHTRFQLIGYCLGGLYATEVARRLAERGAEVADLVLASSHPVVVDVEDDLMIETLFVPNLHLSLDRIGYGPVQAHSAVRAFMQVIERNGGRVPAGSLVEVGGDAELDGIADFFRRLSADTREERFARYARAASEATGQETLPEMVGAMFRVFRQSFLSARFTPEPYAGDIRFLRPRGASGFAPGMDETTLAFWREVCVGEFAVTDIEGNHFSCIEEPNARRVADLVAEPLRRNRENIR
ncbi:non-ribosomal peptide synthetase [Kitasatospora paracochleata]